MGSLRLQGTPSGQVFLGTERSDLETPFDKRYLNFHQRAPRQSGGFEPPRIIERDSGRRLLLRRAAAPGRRTAVPEISDELIEWRRVFEADGASPSGSAPARALGNGFRHDLEIPVQEGHEARFFRLRRPD